MNTDAPELPVILDDAVIVPTYGQIRALQDALLAFEQADLPVTHRFAEGLYSRELFMPQGSALVGKMHAKSHFFVLLSGEITAWTDHGMRRLNAPFLVRTEPGTKRVIYAHVDSTMVTFHATEQTDVDDIEREIIVPEAGEEQFLLEHTA